MRRARGARRPRPLPRRHVRAPPPAREVLFPLYAFNLEVARAPWMTREPLLAEMRLQWWRDVVAGARSQPLPAHEVAGPLAALIAAGRLDPAPLDALIEARRRDIEARPFALSELRPYLEGTAGNLLWAAAAALGATDRTAVLEAGFAQGAASWLLALPALSASGRGLAQPGPEPVRALASEALAALARARAARPGAAAALRAATLAGPVLRAALRDPAAATEGRLALSEGSRRLRLLWATWRGTW
ncbi:squalene/phytoene synthase family protein [Rubellimicrobium sp. CFH 75288]|uniref:squalene/phytoene synthase family protein n=1 Tax=Rubellimicrobium sp. CFH 75288 TaxID=2697034 RepID=UPI00352A105E